MMDRRGADPTVRAISREGIEAADDEGGVIKLEGADGSIVEELDLECLGRTAEEEGDVRERGAVRSIEATAGVFGPEGVVAGDELGRTFARRCAEVGFVDEGG